VAVALHHPEVVGPWADCLAVLMRHHSRNLVEMRQIVCGPRGQQLRESDDAESGMASATIEILFAEIHAPQLFEIR
jgi:hypothetical protein